MPATKTNESHLQDQLIDTIESAQAVVIDSIGSLSERIGNFQVDEVELPNPKAVWDSSFDFVEKVIDSQRKFGEALLDAVTSKSTDA